jgi:DNA primase
MYSLIRAGLMGIEGRLKADIRVTTLPEGLDPDEIALDDPDRWAQLISEAKPVVIHVMETLAMREDFDDPKAKEEIAAQVLPLIEDVRGSVEREAYRQRLARLLKVDERALVQRAAGRYLAAGRRVTHVPSCPASPWPLLALHIAIWKQPVLMHCCPTQACCFMLIAPLEVMNWLASTRKIFLTATIVRCSS